MIIMMVAVAVAASAIVGTAVRRGVVYILYGHIATCATVVSSVAATMPREHIALRRVAVMYMDGTVLCMMAACRRVIMVGFIIAVVVIVVLFIIAVVVAVAVNGALKYLNVFL